MSLFRFTVNNDTCHCEGVKRPSQSAFSLQVVRCNLKILMRLLRRKVLLVMTVNFARFLHFLKCSNIMKRFAFTLAEVLITLGIIGVVAAITLPILVQNYQKHVTVNRLKTFYSAMAQAYQASTAQNGDISEWILPNSNATSDVQAYYDIYFKPYLKTELPSKQSVSKHKYFLGYANTYTFYTMSNGAIFLFGPSVTSNYIYIIFDINGFQAPNLPGRDIFFMRVIPQKGVVLFGGGGKHTREELISGVPINGGKDTSCCAKTCATSAYNKHNCAALIQLDGWRILKDYPW